MKKEVKISVVKNNPNNPRLIKDDKFKKLVKSIKSFPEMLEKRPIVVDEDMMVLGGNMRLKASAEAGLKDYEPNLAPMTTYDDVTKEEIEREAQKLAVKMIQEQKGTEVICPECGEEFEIQ